MFSVEVKGIWFKEKCLAPDWLIIKNGRKMTLEKKDGHLIGKIEWKGIGVKDVGLILN